jgi:hypothetical protein
LGLFDRVALLPRDGTLPISDRSVSNV